MPPPAALGVRVRPLLAAVVFLCLTVELPVAVRGADVLGDRPPAPTEVALAGAGWKATQP